MAAPHHSPKRRSLDTLPPKWVNPCGFYPSSDEGAQSSDVPDLPTSREFLHTIYIQAKNALDSVERFKKNYVKEVFDVDYDSHHKSWKGYRYEWLYPSSAVRKELGVNTHPDELRDVQLDSFLKDAYRYMQIMAVAMEQVAFDHAHPEHGSVFADQFKDVEYKLKAVLCEIQGTMIERGVEPYDDVTRDVMAADIRDMEPDSRRDLRDWFIFRDYMIVLEYIRDVVKYFYDNPSRIPPS
uniref:Uncharacterized protein n=1 Tax=Graphocephala atropunctata TaxID=36148 RepID=A0A1B6LR27_9HEMI